ncbi:uncharacterized protein LOC143610708 [Bidens hawaiensis]|uniref:uncharacterized protein LOC143610708 n=1 Tax=Bidens hawaiensis TaxID=980011 RepID=UPI004049CAB5
MASSSSKVSLKLLIDKNGQRVLFAEAGKDFVDFLCSLLVLPVGTVIKLLEKQDMKGGLPQLYQSISDLNNDYIQPNQTKNVLLNPKSSLPFSSSHISLLPPEAVPSQYSTSNSATGLYMCVLGCGLRSTYSRMCPSHSKSNMNTIDDNYVLKSVADAKGGGFVKGMVTYMVMDDLSVSPISTIDNITLLNKFNIKDLGSLEGLELLKHSLNSKTVLTDVFLRDAVVKDENLKKSETDAKGGGFVKGLVTYMVMDDLSVSPMSTIDNITMLNKFNIKDLGALEGKVVHIGMNEGLELLKHSLNSKTVLTDVFLRDVDVKDDNLKKV